MHLVVADSFYGMFLLLVSFHQSFDLPGSQPISWFSGSSHGVHISQSWILTKRCLDRASLDKTALWLLRPFCAYVFRRSPDFENENVCMV